MIFRYSSKLEVRTDGSYGYKAGNGFEIPNNDSTQTAYIGTSVDDGTQSFTPTELLQHGCGRTEKCYDIGSTCSSTDGSECHVPLTNIAL